MLPILLDYVAGFPLRFHRRRIISRESALLSSDAFDHVLHPVKECQYHETYSSDIIFYLFSNWKISGDANIFTIKSSYRLFRDHLANERN